MSKTKQVILFTVVVFVLIVLGCIWYIRHDAWYPSTDDAYVHAHIVQIAAQVGGPVVHLPVSQYEMVKAHQLLFQIDPEPYELAVQQAHDRWLTSMQTNQMKQRQLEQAKLLVTQRHSEWQEAKRQAERMHVLAKTHMVATAQVDEADNRLAVSEAALQSAVQQRLLAKNHLGGVGDHDPAVHAAWVAWEQAKLNLAHTSVRAPANGQIATLPLRVGSVVQAGQPLFSMLETGQWWVIANFKETQIARMRVGQVATVTVDVIPHRLFHGVVSAISQGSGQSFSLLPAENATGNWVKVTQRFSVRIDLHDVHGTHEGLRNGASAEVTVDVRSDTKKTMNKKQ